ncbi:MAG: Hsp70 family protein [Prevotellaceae bacterium]|jgi:molecular chaperone DnaK (HSP70)|nr:Hsp70 family protein [Prevotellaceae bacterium]
MDDTRLVFGIDLGTTYSCVAQVDQFDQAVVLRNFEGKSTTPSVVYFGEDGTITVGEDAKDASKTEPERTVSFIKRSISTDDAYNKPTKFPMGLDPTEISSYILKKIVKDANDAGQSDNEVKKVVITCPAYFGSKERERTKQAGIMAGLEVLAVLNEPTAAAIAYGMKVSDKKNIIVYDLGGGTFDVTIIRVNNGAITVIATGGDHHLGGVDWDTELAKYMLNQFNKEHGKSYGLDDDPVLRNQLMILAEEKKKSLSARDTVKATVTYEGDSTKMEITRDIFDQLTEFHLDETIEKTKEVIEIAKNKGTATIDEVLLVGGSSRMPQIKQRVDAELHCDAKLTDPDECVAKCAAIFALNESYNKAMEEYSEGMRDEPPAKMIRGTGGATGRINVINVTSKTYGMGCLDSETGADVVENLIFANSPLNGNCKASSTFYTVQDNQSGVSLPVFESDVTDEVNERTIPQNAAIPMEEGEPSVLKLTKKWPKETPIKVIFDIDTDGILHVHAEVEQDSIDFEMRIKGVKGQEELEAATAKIARAKIQ